MARYLAVRQTSIQPPQDLPADDAPHQPGFYAGPLGDSEDRRNLAAGLPPK